jgi:lysophospholipase L1-like esterase
MINRSGKPIVFILTHNANNYRISNGYAETANITLDEWFEGILKMCKKYSVPVVDLFNKSPLMTKITTLKKFTVNLDGVHPNTEGYKLYYVPEILSVLKSVCER